MVALNLLIATWGSPWADPCRPREGLSWGEVTYVGISGKEVRSRTTLPLLLEELSPEGVLILACDTVACCSDLREGEGYGDLREAVRRKYVGFIKDILSAEGLSDCVSRVEVAVVPCLGRFRNGEFDVEVSDTRLWILYELMNFLVSKGIKGGGGGEELNIYLDLTHGPNYVPTITYSALRSLLHHVAFSNLRVRLRVLNTDPYVRGVTDKLRVNVVEDTEIQKLTEWQPTESDSKLGFKSRQASAGIPADINKKLEQVNRSIEPKEAGKVINDLTLLYASVHLGLPLLTLEALSRVSYERVRKTLKELFNTHLSQCFTAEASGEGNQCKLIVKEIITIRSPKLTEFTIKAATLLAALEKSVRQHTTKREGPTLRELGKVREAIAWNEVINLVISNELHKIKEVICEYILTKSMEGEDKANISKEHIEKCVGTLKQLEKGAPLADIIKELGREVGSFNPRNFLAHAGLEYNTIKAETHATLKYREEYMKEIIKTVKNAIKLGQNKQPQTRNHPTNPH